MVKNLAKNPRQGENQIKSNIQTGFHPKDFSDLENWKLLFWCPCEAKLKSREPTQGVQSLITNHLFLHFNLVPQRTTPWR